MSTLPVVPIALPTPFAVGDVNVYLIRSEPLTLIDAGTATLPAENALKLAFAREGLFLEALQRVVITHAHADHYGLASRIAELSGAELFIGADDVTKVQEGTIWLDMDHILLDAGIPYEFILEMRKHESEVRKIHPRLQEVKPLADGDVLEFEDLTLQVGKFPGHTGGHICLYEPTTGTMFSGDTLLPSITPNPLWEPDPNEPDGRRKSLVQYMESLTRLEAMDLRIVYPGHGVPITDAPALLASYRAHHARRADRIAAMLSPEGVTAFQLARKMYAGRPTEDQFLATSEIIAHLDVLIAQGRAEVEQSDELMLFRAGSA